MPPTDKAFYVTTPIYYVSAEPHIGNAYTTVAADVLARWHRQRGEQAWFLTGTDEHGQKVMRAAQAHGLTPQQWTDQLVESAWRPVLDTIDARADDFIRTTEQRHVERVREFWQRLYDAGDVYEAAYEGPYCVACEEFKLPGELVDDDGEQLCPIHGKPVEAVSERNYFFRLSRYGDQLLQLYADRPDFVAPESARNEVVAFVKQGLQDLSITRSSFDWAFRVRWAGGNFFSVGLTALLNS